jgi:glutaredoxin-like protein NrdH
MSDIAIDVYSRPNCMPCKMTKRALHDAGATYTEHDVSADPDAAQRVRDLGYAAVPVVTVTLPDGLDHWHGYRAEKLAAAVYLEREGRL